MVNLLLNTLEKFAEDLEKHPDFELYVFKTFEGLHNEQINELENKFQEVINNEDDQFMEIDETFSRVYFMPHSSKEELERLYIPQSPCRLNNTLKEFYQTTNGLQFVWGYKNIKNLEKFKTGYHISMYTKKDQPAPWDRYNSIYETWGMGSIFIRPLEEVFGFHDEGNLYWHDRASNVFYPVLPFDCYSDWSAGALLLKEGQDFNELVIGEDYMASFNTKNVYSMEAYFQSKLLETKGSILIRNKKKRLDLSIDWTLDELAKKIDMAEEIGSWGLI